jgi:hypothetical protein
MALGQPTSDLRFAESDAEKFDEAFVSHCKRNTPASSDMEHLSGVFSPDYIAITWRLR